MSKKAILILVGIVLLLTALWAGGKYYATQRVERFIEEANTSDNQLEIADWSVSMGLLSVGIHAENVRLRQRAGNYELHGTLAELSMKGLSIRSLLFRQQPRIHALSLTEPQFTLIKMAGDTTQQDTANSNHTLPLIEDFNLHNGSFTHQYGTDSTGALRLLGINVAREDFSLSSIREGWSNVQLTVDSVYYPTRKRDAAWHLSKLEYAPDESVLTVAGIQLSPYETAATYLGRQQYAKGWLAVDFSDLRFQPFHPDSVLAQRPSLHVDSLIFGSISLANYVDPALPDEPDKPNKLMPVEQFRRLGFPLTVKQVAVQQAQIIYAMLGEDDEPAALAFTNARIEMRNLSTQPTPDSLYVDVFATFDREADLEAHFTFDQSGDGRTLSLRGEVGAYDLKNINPLMVTAANAYVESGQLNLLRYQAEIHQEVATGQLLFRYDDLDFDLQNAWFKNLIKGAVINDRNPEKDGDLRYGRIYHEHSAERSFFNLYWKAILSGLKSTVAASIVTSKALKATEIEGRKRKKK